MTISRTVSLLALGILLAAALPAQNVQGRDDLGTRSVKGIVTDASNKSVAGAVVQLKDTKTLQIRSFYTQSDGSYHFAGLSTNVDYELRAEHAGLSSGSKTLSSFNSKKIASVDLKLKAN